MQKKIIFSSFLWHDIINFAKRKKEEKNNERNKKNCVCKIDPGHLSILFSVIFVRLKQILLLTLNLFRIPTYCTDFRVQWSVEHVSQHPKLFNKFIAFLLWSSKCVLLFARVRRVFTFEYTTVCRIHTKLRDNSKNPIKMTQRLFRSKIDCFRIHCSYNRI